MDILEKIKDSLKSSLCATDQAFLFGSRARGTAHSDSDWDILIILDKDRLCASDYDKVTYPLTYLGWVVDAKINPVMYSKKEWEAQKTTFFFTNVNHDAIKII